MFKFPILLLTILFASLCHAFINNPMQDQELDAIITKVQTQKKLNLAQRLDLISKTWLNRPYSMYCLGEGPHAEFDQRPLYRTDAFDCETFVDTTLALAHAKNLAEFKANMNRIRYHHAHVDFLHRNHFTNIDWNQNNQDQHLIRDISQQIKYKNHSLSKISTTIINKKAWYRQLALARVFLLPPNEEQQKQKLMQLHQKAQFQGEFVSSLTYIPIKKLYDKQGHPIQAIFHQIPHGSIIQIVTPRSHTKEKIGTDLDISHMGFVFHAKDKVLFRHASFSHQRVEELPLEQYLQLFIHHPIIKGIHLELPLDEKNQ